MDVDAAIAAATPIVGARKHGQPDMPPSGQCRYVVARETLMLEGASNVLHARRRIATLDSAMHTPFGEIDETELLIHGRLPRALRAEAEAAARRACPKEWAGWIWWDAAAQEYRLWQALDNAEAQVARIRYQIPRDIDPADVVMDIHSHGKGAAYFSGTDDADDRMWAGPCVLSAVIGRCDLETPEWATRLVLNGKLFDSIRAAGRGSSA